MSEKILYVDDDPNILAGYQRILRKQFPVFTAMGGHEGLETIAKEGPFAVVISDMQMPEMNGIEFLAKVNDISPDTVRIMLTGNADLQTSIDAVNEGRIFHFLTKPCPREKLIKSVETAIRQHHLIVAERQLLEETLNGSVKVMADILSMVSPMAFGRSGRVRRYVRHITNKLCLLNAWEIEIAAMLSQVGCISLPDMLLKKLYAHQTLTPQEQDLFNAHPDVGGRLIVNIPRLKDAAHMIACQQEPFSWHTCSDHPKDRDRVALGGHILKVALDFDESLLCGISSEQTLEDMCANRDLYDHEIVETLFDVEVTSASNQRHAVLVDQLAPGMILDQDVYSTKGGLLVTKGNEITLAVREHLCRWSSGVGIEEPIRVITPGCSMENEPETVPASG